MRGPPSNVLQNTDYNEAVYYRHLGDPQKTVLRFGSVVGSRDGHARNALLSQGASQSQVIYIVARV